MGGRPCSGWGLNPGSAGYSGKLSGHHHRWGQSLGLSHSASECVLTCERGGWAPGGAPSPRGHTGYHGLQGKEKSRPPTPPTAAAPEQVVRARCHFGDCGKRGLSEECPGLSPWRGERGRWSEARPPPPPH